jgi:acetyl esterase/lipase
MKRLVLAFVALLTLSMPVAAPTTDLHSSVALFQKVRTVPNQVYARANGCEGKLDVYARRAQTPTRTVIFIHGGGWV